MVLVPESDPRANITHHTFNDVLPLLMGQYLGPGLLGLGVTAMIAGFMSGMAGNVSAFATVWTYDVYRPLLQQERQRPALPEHGPLVLDPRRADLDRHGLLRCSSSRTSSSSCRCWSSSSSCRCSAR